MRKVTGPNKDDYDSNESYLFRKLCYECKKEETLDKVLLIGKNDLRNYFFNYDGYYGDTIEEMKNINHKFFNFKLPIDGDFIMEFFNIKPSNEVGEILNKCLNFCFVNPNKTSKEDLIDYLNYLKFLKNENNR